MYLIIAFGAGCCIGFFISVFGVVLMISAGEKKSSKPLTKEEWKSGKRPKEIY